MGRLIDFSPAPGVVKDLTTNAATGGWVDTDKVRFRKNFPEKMGGWAKATTQAFVGICRNMYTWITLDSSILTAIGCPAKYYVEESGLLTDVTPIRLTAALGANPFTSLSGSGVITVAHTSHGASVGDYVTFSGATAFNSLTTGNLNKEQIVTVVVDANSYKVDTGGTASATSAGGGAGVTAAYQLTAGSSSAVFGSGWGAGAWGHSGGWGSAATVTTLSASMRLWSQSNWGEDLLFAPRYGAIYRYDGSSGGRATAISVEGGASQVPSSVIEIMVATNSRIVIAFGVNPIGSAVLDPLFIRWSDYENYLEWNPSTTTAAGGFRLTIGSTIVTAIQARQEILVWTDAALYGMPFVGEGDIFQSYLLDSNTTIIGALAKVMLNGIVYWMGQRGFRYYDGSMNILKCPVEDYVFDGMNMDQQAKVVCGSNARYNEVWWLYPSGEAEEPDRYVVFNVEEQVWYVGSLERSYWLDRGVYDHPRAAGTDGYLYTHEFGLDDGSTEPPSAILSYAESAPIEIGPNDSIGRGDRIAFVNRLIPDVTFRNSTAAAPTLTYVFKQRNYSGSAYVDESASIAKGATVDQYTQKKSIRLRSRATALRVENEEVGADWRLGVQRFETRTDGRKT